MRQGQATSIASRLGARRRRVGRSGSETAWAAFLYLIVLSMVVTGGFLGGAQADAQADARGEVREETIDGVRWVHNPRQPEGGRVARELTERWRVGGPESDEIFGAIAGVVRTDEGHIAVLDNQLCEIRLFSRDGEALQTMGGRGEGPGQFLQGIGLTTLPGGGLGVVQSFPGKLITYFPDGTPAGEIVPRLSGKASPQSFLVVYRAQRVGDRLMMASMDQVFGQNGMTQHHVLGVFELDGTLAAELWSERATVDMSRGYPMDEKAMTRYSGVLGRDDGTVVAALDWADYRIQVFGAEGEPILGITREYTPLDRSPEERRMVEEVFAGFTRNVPNARLEIAVRHRSVEEMHWGPGGELWVLSSEGRYRAPEGSMGVYDVYDPQAGRFLRQVDLRAPGDPTRDSAYPLGDQVVVIRGFYDAVLGMSGGAAEESAPGEEAPEEISIICYDL